jgi:hypothetical protein
MTPAFPWPARFPLVASQVETTDLVRARGFGPAKDKGDLAAAVALIEEEPFHSASSVRHKALLTMLTAGRGTRLLTPVPPSPEPGNMLPLAYAAKIAAEFSVPLDLTLKRNVAKHTGESSLVRFVRRPQWAVAEVVRGARYVLVDDVLTSGVSLAEMRQQVLGAGGLVAGVTTLAYTAITDKARASVMTPHHLALRPETVCEMERRFGSDALAVFFTRRGIYGGQWRAMTEGEAWLIRHYRSVDEFAVAIERAEQAEIARRGTAPVVASDSTRERAVLRHWRGVLTECSAIQSGNDAPLPKRSASIKPPVASL